MRSGEKRRRRLSALSTPVLDGSLAAAFDAAASAAASTGAAAASTGAAAASPGAAAASPGPAAASPAAGGRRRVRHKCFCGCGRPGTVRVNPKRADLDAWLKVIIPTYEKRFTLVSRWADASNSGQQVDARAAREHWAAAADAAAAAAPATPVDAEGRARKRRRVTTAPSLRATADGGLTADIPPVTPQSPAATPTASLLRTIARALPEDAIDATQAVTAVESRLCELRMRLARAAADVEFLRREARRSHAARVAAPSSRAILTFDSFDGKDADLFKHITGWPPLLFRAFYDLVNAHGPDTEGMLDGLELYSATKYREAIATHRHSPALPTLRGASAAVEPAHSPHASVHASPARPSDVPYSVPLRRGTIGRGRRRALSSINALFLVFVVLRTGLTFRFIAWLFGVSKRTATSVFVSVVTALDRWLNVEMPDLAVDVAAALTPPALASRLGSRVPTYVTDATEVRKERAAVAALHKREYSDYKKAPTIKFEVTAHACGAITHVSNGYPGKTSDNELIAASGLLHRLPRGSRVLVDRGYTEMQQAMDAVGRGQVALMPGFREHGHQQLEATRVEEGANISNPRMVIERLIGRVKGTYKWFGTTHAATLDIYCAALRVAARLTNYSPLLGEGITPSVGAAARVPLEPQRPSREADSLNTSQVF